MSILGFIFSFKKPSPAWPLENWLCRSAVVAFIAATI
jgi:hypothetical protein